MVIFGMFVSQWNETPARAFVDQQPANMAHPPINSEIRSISAPAGRQNLREIS
jgi:hypothetical protein